MLTFITNNKLIKDVEKNLKIKYTTLILKKPLKTRDTLI